jgi:hypothetical protein
MPRVAPFLVSVCFVLCACSSSSNPGDSTGEGGASAAGFGSGGVTSVGGTSAAGGAAAGTMASGGASATGGDAGTNAMGGNIAQGGSVAMAGTGGAGGQGGSPPSPIDYSIWLLQLPTGSGTSPTTVSPSKLASYSDAYFYVADDGGQIFKDPVTGITTPGSAHPRTELRESAPSGGEAAWSASATNTMTVSGKVLQGTSVTIAQVFNGPQSIPLGELQYNSGKGGFELFYEEAKGGGSETDLKTPIALGSKYTFTIALSQGVLSVTVNGKQVYSHAPSSGILSSTFYFKVGDYDQTATAGGISTTPRSMVENYSVVVVHE